MNFLEVSYTSLEKIPDNAFLPSCQYHFIIYIYFSYLLFYYTVLNPFVSWSAVIQDIYDDEIEPDLLDKDERENFPETEENIAQNNQQAQNLNYSAIDYVATGLYAATDQEAAMDQGILNVITNWNTAPTCQSSQDSGLASSLPTTFQSL